MNFINRSYFIYLFLSDRDTDKSTGKIRIQFHWLFLDKYFDWKRGRDSTWRHDWTRTRKTRAISTEICPWIQWKWTTWETVNMREEIGAAVLFITRLIRQSGSVSSEKVVEFSNSLSAILNEKFQNHWYQDHPTKGQGYRCIRINSSEPIDPVLEKAARNSGLQYHDLRLPSELTLWVDPKDVCCRYINYNSAKIEMLNLNELFWWNMPEDYGRF